MFINMNGNTRRSSCWGLITTRTILRKVGVVTKSVTYMQAIQTPTESFKGTVQGSSGEIQTRNLMLNLNILQIILFFVVVII